MYRFSPGSCNFAEYSYILYLCAYSNEHLRTPTPTRISANCWVVKYRNSFKLELFQQYDFCSLHFTSADFKCQIHFLFSDDPPTIFPLFIIIFIFRSSFVIKHYVSPYFFHAHFSATWIRIFSVILYLSSILTKIPT